MTPDPAIPRSRRKVLFLSFTYPSSRGSGSQLRAAALIRMLASDSDVHLLMAGYTERVGGPPDAAMEKSCRKMTHLRILPSQEAGGKWPQSNTSAEVVALPAVDCVPGGAAEWIVRYYQENKLDALFVFRFDSLHFVQPRLDFFPVRHLDLDELPSRRQAQIARLKQGSGRENSTPAQMTARVATQLMEKALLPRFHRVFVSSAVEAEVVRRQTGFPQAWVLPNVYPARSTPPARQTSTRTEILFVGSFFYYPNVDAVLYFCREILPLIQEKKRDSVLFRIIGLGDAGALESVRNQRGVDLAGYQENLTPFYTEASLVVVPLRAGVGTRLKILEAFVHGRVVVSTSIGAEGLEVTDRENILLADCPDAFAQACLELIDHPELAEKICAGAARLHRERYSEEALLRCYAKINAAEHVSHSPAPAAIL